MSAPANREPITIWAPDNINQSTTDYLAELIRAGGIAYLRANPSKTLHEGDWRDKPYMDGVAVDLDEAEVVDFIAAFIIGHANPDSEADS